MGSKMFKKLREHINDWLEEQHLTETALKVRLAELLDAKEKKRFFHEGKIIESEEYPAWYARAKGLELAMKAKGMLKERVDLSGRVDTVNHNQYSEEELKAARKAAKIIIEQERKKATRSKMAIHELNKSRRLEKVSKTTKLIISTMICLTIGVLGGLFTKVSLAWYPAFEKTFFALPSWTALSMMMVISAYLIIWKKGLDEKQVGNAPGVFLLPSTSLYLSGENEVSHEMSI